MIDSVSILTFQITSIAEINSSKLLDYEQSLNYYFSDNSNSKFYQRYFKWFDHSKFEKINNSFLMEFEQWFYDFFQFYF